MKERLQTAYDLCALEPQASVRWCDIQNIFLIILSLFFLAQEAHSVAGDLAEEDAAANITNPPLSFHLVFIHHS